MSWEILSGDAEDHLCNWPDSTFDSVVTDPPYSYNFMGNSWDNLGRGFQGWCSEWGAEVLRVLKPGGHALVFGGARTYHRLVCGLEDAGFEIRDSIHWIYGSGFPKSRDISKAIDKETGAEREVVGVNEDYLRRKPNGMKTEGASAYGYSENQYETDARITAPATEAAKQWEGWGTALKPAYEPIVVARKPLAAKHTVAANVLEFGTGGINIDGCRVDANGEYFGGSGQAVSSGTTLGKFKEYMPGPNVPGNPEGRWPSNIVLSHTDGCLDWICTIDCPVAELDRQSGQSVSRKQTKTKRQGGKATNFAMSTSGQTHSDSGGASRYFPVFLYHAKAGRSERPCVDGVKHPTVKPVELIRWLVRLVTPPGGYVLDPFAGSGTTAEACELEGLSSAVIEQNPAYIKLTQKRMSKYMKEVAA